MRWVLLFPILFFVATVFAQEPVIDGRPLNAWLDQLKGGELTTRRAAAALLAQKIPSDARDAAVQLALALKDPDRRLRMDVVKAINRLGGAGQMAAVTRLVDDLSIKSQRNDAIRALGDLGPNARAAGPNVLTTMQSADNDKVLQVIGARTVVALDNRAARTLVPVLVNGLRDADRDVRRQAAGGLGELGGQVGGRATQPLIEALKDTDQEVRVMAAWALVRVESREAGKGINALIEIIGMAENDKTRTQAIESLADLGTTARSALEPLRSMLKHSDFGPRMGAVVALHAIDSKSTTAEIVPVLIAGLKDNKTDVRVAALDALRQFGPHTTMVVTAFLADLNKSSLEYARCSTLLDTISRLGEAAVPGLIAVSKDRETDHRVVLACVECLGKIGRPAKDAVPTLISMLEDRQQALLHRHVIASLGRIGGVALPAIKPLLSRDEVQLRVLGVHALGAMEADARPMLGELKTLAKNDPAVRAAAELAIRRIESSR